MNKWISEPNPKRLRRLGKTGEELGELSSVVSRCIIQGVDEVDPSSEKTNRQRLSEEIADVIAQIDLTIDEFNLDRTAIWDRISRKTGQMREWEAHFD